ncbi:MAG: phage tail protein [Pseudomonadota bacterium]
MTTDNRAGGALGDLGNLAFVAGLPSSVQSARRLLGLPDFPAVATAATIAAKLRGLDQIESGDATGGKRLTMLAIGLFVFGVDTLAYQELQRRTEYRHAGAERLGAPPAWQFLGPGADTITLPGILLPELVGDYASIESLREMGATGEAWPLVLSNGTILGQYFIRLVEERQSNFLPGGAPRRIEFNIDLERADG